MARVLVVDDEKLIVKGIRFSLEQDGYEVDCAYDGDEAIERAKEREYDVVLLDVMLPGHDGFEVCQTIREFSEMPIIMPMTVTAVHIPVEVRLRPSSPLRYFGSQVMMPK